MSAELEESVRISKQAARGSLTILRTESGRLRDIKTSIEDVRMKLQRLDVPDDARSQLDHLCMWIDELDATSRKIQVELKHQRTSAEYITEAACSIIGRLMVTKKLRLESSSEDLDRIETSKPPRRSLNIDEPRRSLNIDEPRRSFDTDEPRRSLNIRRGPYTETRSEPGNESPRPGRAVLKPTLIQRPAHDVRVDITVHEVADELRHGDAWAQISVGVL